MLGINQNYPELFEGINWSTSQVFKETLQIINNQKISNHLMEKLTDIDTSSDLYEWIKNINISSDELLVKFTKGYLESGLKNTL